MKFHFSFPSFLQDLAARPLAWHLNTPSFGGRWRDFHKSLASISLSRASRQLVQIHECTSAIHWSALYPCAQLSHPWTRRARDLEEIYEQYASADWEKQSLCHVLKVDLAMGSLPKPISSVGTLGSLGLRLVALPVHNLASAASNGLRDSTLVEISL